MDKNEITKLLEGVADGKIPVEDAVLTLRSEPFRDLGYAKPDFHRGIRQGKPEVIYGEGKTSGQIAGIVHSLAENGQKKILITRLNEDKADKLRILPGFEYYGAGRIGVIGGFPSEKTGKIVVAAAGTSDISVAEEAALTSEFYGNNTVRIYDVGVAGIHRLMSYTDEIMSARAVIAAAGMEGALASVIGGLADCPVIALPTSIGYGASFGGLAALLSMLNSCASGVSVVNIDNGFGAAYLASMINHMGGA